MDTIGVLSVFVLLFSVQAAATVVCSKATLATGPNLSCSVTIDSAYLMQVKWKISNKMLKKYRVIFVTEKGTGEETSNIFKIKSDVASILLSPGYYTVRIRREDDSSKYSMCNTHLELTTEANITITTSCRYVIIPSKASSSKTQTPASTDPSPSPSQTPYPHAPPAGDQHGNSNKAELLAGISGGVVVLIVFLVGIIIIVTTLICVKSQRKAYRRRYPINETYLCQASNLSPDMMVDRPLPNPVLIQQNNTFPIPSEGCKPQTHCGQDYEMPMSQNNTISRGTNLSPLHVYSTLDDAATEKCQYNGHINSSSSDGGATNYYKSLYPPNIDDAQPYISYTPSMNRMSPQPHNEPAVHVSSPGDNMKSQSNQEEQPEIQGSFNNAVYFEQNGVKKTDDNTYFMLEKCNVTISQISTQERVHLDKQNVNPNSTCTTGHYTQDSSHSHGIKSEPTHFEAERLNHSLNDGSGDTAVYFQLDNSYQQNSNDTPTAAHQTQLKSN